MFKMNIRKLCAMWKNQSETGGNVFLLYLK